MQQVNLFTKRRAVPFLAGVIVVIGMVLQLAGTWPGCCAAIGIVPQSLGVSGSANNVQLECVCTTLALALAVAAICCERRDSGIILQTAIDTAGDIHDVLSRRVSRRRHDTVSYGASASESTVGFLRSQRAVYRTAETEMCHGYRDITSAISRRSGRAF